MRGEVCGIQTERDTSNAACDPRDAHTLGAWACSSPNPVSGEIGLCLLLRPSVCACGKDLESFWRLNLRHGHSSPSKPKTRCPAMLRPPGMRSPLLLGSRGPGFSQQECLAAVLAGQDSGRAGKLQPSTSRRQGAARRPRVLVLPGPELERKRRKKCLNTVL